MRELISRRESFFERVVLPIAMVAALVALGGILTQRLAWPSGEGFAALAACLWLLYGILFGVKKLSRGRRAVWLEGSELIVSSPSGEERVPLSLVRSVNESRFGRQKVITVTWLRKPNLPEEFFFEAPWEPRQIPLTDHPIVKRLRLLVDEVGQRDAKG